MNKEQMENNIKELLGDFADSSVDDPESDEKQAGVFVLYGT